MPNSENVTTKFKVDISDLKSNIAEANRQLKTAQAEMKNATAGMQKGEKTVDSLSAQISAQSKIVEAEEKKLAALKSEMERYNAKMQEGESTIADLTQKHAQAAAEYGENSDQVKELAKQLKDAQAAQERNKTAVENLNTRIINQDTAVKNAQGRVNLYQTALENLQREEQESANKTETLTDKVKRQETELKNLKTQYANVAAEQGTTSAEAQTLATRIENLSGDLKDNRNKLNEAEQAADKYDQSLEDVGDEAENTSNGGLSTFGVMLGNLAANIISSAISKMKELIAETVNVGKTFDTSMSQVGAVSGAAGDELEDLRDKAKEMGANTKFSASEAADAFNYMAMAGWKTEDMINGIDGVLNLAAASGADLATTSDIVTDALTAMGYSAGDAGRLADVMAAASSNANTNVTMMGQTFQYAAPIVGALGYSMEDTAVAIGLMANAGIKADKAGTALRSILTRLSAPPKECAAAMNKLGISMTDSEGNMKTLDEVMQDLRVAFDGLGETEQTAAAKHIAGAQAMSGLLAIVNAAPEDFNKLTDAVANSEGAAEKMANTMLDNLGGEMTLLSSKLEGVQLAIYEKFEPALRKGVEILDKLLDVVQFVVDHSTEFIAALGGMAAAVGAYLAYTTALKIMTEGWKSLTIVTKAQAAAQAALNAVMALNPIGLVIAAIVGLVAAFVILWNKSEAFRNFWIGLWDKIKEVAGVAWSAISGIFTAAWDKVQEIWGGIVEFFSDLWEGVKEVFAPISNWINDYVFKPIMNLFQPVIGFYATAFKIIFELAKGCWELIKIVWGIVAAWFNEHIITPVKDFFTAMWNDIETAALNAWNGIKTVWAVVSGWFNEHIITPVKNFFTGMWNGLKTGAAAAWNGIKTVFAPVADWFKEKFKNAWEKVKAVFSTGGKIFSGIKEGIENAFKTVVNAIIRGINKVIAFPFNKINDILDKIRNVEIAGYSPFENLVSRFSVPQIPELATGGIIRKPTLAEIGENGQEAVIPLEKNKAGLKKIAGLISQEIGASGVGLSKQTINNYTYNFDQTNNSPKALSRWEIYRQTKNLLSYVQG